MGATSENPMIAFLMCINIVFRIDFYIFKKTIIDMKTKRNVLSGNIHGEQKPELNV